MRRALLLAAALAVTAAACGGTESLATTTVAPTTTAEAVMGDEVVVSIEGFAFGPQEITVAPGTTVTWVNDEDAIPHTSTSDDGVWNSGTLDPGERFSFTFDEPGAYPYVCTFHPSMTGTIVVEG